MTWVVFVAGAVLSWGVYGAMLHQGQMQLGNPLKALLCVGVAYFLVGVSISLALLWFVGEYGMAELKLACFLAPGVLVGFLLSTHLAPLLGRQATRWAVLGVSGVGTVVVIVRTEIGRAHV